MKFISFFYFCGSFYFCPPGSGSRGQLNPYSSGSTTLLSRILRSGDGLIHGYFIYCTCTDDVTFILLFVVAFMHILHICTLHTVCTHKPHNLCMQGVINVYRPSYFFHKITEITDLVVIYTCIHAYKLL
jgi:hypothetical protein